jgi:hypothetical protein
MKAYVAMPGFVYVGKAVVPRRPAKKINLAQRMPSASEKAANEKAFREKCQRQLLALLANSEAWRQLNSLENLMAPGQGGVAKTEEGQQTQFKVDPRYVEFLKTVKFSDLDNLVEKAEGAEVALGADAKGLVGRRVLQVLGNVASVLLLVSCLGSGLGAFGCGMVTLLFLFGAIVAPQLILLAVFAGMVGGIIIAVASGCLATKVFDALAQLNPLVKAGVDACKALKIHRSENVAVNAANVKTHRDNFLRELGGNAADNKKRLVFQDAGAEAVVTGERVGDDREFMFGQP